MPRGAETCRAGAEQTSGRLALDRVVGRAHAKPPEPQGVHRQLVLAFLAGLQPLLAVAPWMSARIKVALALADGSARSTLRRIRLLAVQTGRECGADRDEMSA